MITILKVINVDTGQLGVVSAEILQHKNLYRGMKFSNFHVISHRDDITQCDQHLSWMDNSLYDKSATPIGGDNVNT